MGQHITLFWPARVKISDDVVAFGRGLGVLVREGASVGYRKIRAGHLQDNYADLGVASGNFSRRKITRGNVVVVPETERYRLPLGEKLPHLGREDTEMSAGIGGGFRPRVAGQDVQHPHAEGTVLVLLTPDSGWQVHQRSERAVGAAKCPNSDMLFGVH